MDYTPLKQQQQQQKSFKESSKLAKPLWGSGQHHHGAESLMSFGFGISKLALVVGAACACSFFYIVLLVLTSQPCWPYHSYSCKARDCSTTSSSNFAMMLNTTGSTSASYRPMHEQGKALRASLDSNLVPLATTMRHDASNNETTQRSSNRTTTTTQSTSVVAAGAGPRTYETSLSNIVFGIAASARLWEKRKEYVKLWWRPREMRGYVWLEKKVRRWSSSYPPFRISGSTGKFNYTNKMGSRAAIRISRIVSETFRVGLPDVHWFVMGDDDTVFIPENLVRILSKYDHRKYYYIGSSSESHTQNLHFSYNMAYGGGGFAISYPLAKALEKMQDGCLHRYPYLFGSDDRIQACMAELGVPLTKEPGFHQFDIYGDASGLLSAHPVSPLISIHHLDVIYPVFPNMSQVQALQHLRRSIRVDPGGILQQSICYDKWRKWSFSVSWGYAVQVFRGILPPRELELPARTFISWYRRTEDSGFPFSSRGVSRNPCEQPTVFYMQNVGLKDPGRSVSTYTRETRRRGDCKWKMASPVGLDWIRVTRERTDKSWHQAPRRQCCRILNSNKKNVEMEVGPCRMDEAIIA